MLGFHLFNLKVLTLITLLWVVTSARTMKAWFVAYCVGIAGVYLLLIRFNNDVGVIGRIIKGFMQLPIHVNHYLQLFNKWFPWIVGGLMVLGVIRIIYIRHMSPVLETFIHKYLRIRMDSKPGDAILRVKFKIEDWVNKAQIQNVGFFIGLSPDRKPIVLDERALTQGVQVVGPPGTGKSVLLFNLALQSIERGKACCFVDGKGDMSFIHLLQAKCGLEKKFQDFKFFIPTSPQQSHSYNPLVSIEDPGELTDLIAVGLNLNVPGPGKVYSDSQKAYLLLLFNLFLDSGKKFNFIDMLCFTNYPDAREHVYGLVGQRHLVDDMEQFFQRLKKNEPELLGLTTQIQKLFCADPDLASILNTYSSDIVVKDILENKQFCLFSLSSGKKAETNEALAKIVIADMSNAVGERMGRHSAENDFALFILDEFGQYAPTGTFDKFISTARGSKVGCVLSHQSNSQLIGRDGVDRLAPIVRECTSTTVLFRQSEEADFWSKVFGTREAMKRTDVIEEGEFLTEKRSSKGSVRATEEFLIHPNTLKKLETGQIAFRSAGQNPNIVTIGYYQIEPNGTPLTPIHKESGIGLDLRKIISGRRPAKENAVEDKVAEGQPVVSRTPRIRL